MDTLPPGSTFVLASSYYNFSLAMLSLFSIISLASAETVASSNCTCTGCWPSVPQASIASKGVQSGLGEPEMSDTAGNTAMSFWTSTAEEDAAAVAAAGKTESFMRQWRDTAFWDVQRSIARLKL